MFVQLNAILTVSIYFDFACGINRAYLFNVSDMCYQHNDDVISDVNDIRSLTGCSIVCAEDSCCSYLFDGVTQRCITYTVYSPSTTSGCGLKYAEINLESCHIPDPVETCEATPGYSYDSTTGTCVLGCTTYGTTFETTIGYALAGLNNQIISGSSEQACKNSCVAATGFVCRSAELSSSGSCFLSEETPQSQPSSYVVDNNYVFWLRNCA